MNKLANECRIDLETGSQTVMSTHSTGVRNILFSAPHNLLISASWDSTLHLHDLSQPGDFSAIRLPSKPFSLSASPTKLVEVGRTWTWLHGNRGRAP
jgi:cell cycle arrest protein BUB3